ncbi:MAG: hypothetical protein JSS51_06260 [Planctomycetes bacterium]|nr:hypothetical protein [Planctomycetota bacterium]
MDVRVTTWSSLLAVWSDFARAAGALPKDGNLGLLRRSVPAIIGLQAVTHALEHIDQLPPEEYSSGQDRASLTIRTLATELESIWRDDAMPKSLRELTSDAAAALEQTRGAGYEFVPETDPAVAPGHAPLEAWKARRSAAARVFAVGQGKRVRAGLPVAFVAGVGGRPLAREDLLDLAASMPGCLWRRVARMRQVYESPDPRGVRQVEGDAGRTDLGSALLVESAPVPEPKPAPLATVSGANAARGSL